jgi:hypothetical protein
VSIHEQRDCALRATFPGPSRTITVEPIQIPTTPAVAPVVAPERLPEPGETDSPREPSPVR